MTLATIRHHASRIELHAPDVKSLRGLQQRALVESQYLLLDDTQTAVHYLNTAGLKAAKVVR